MGWSFLCQGEIDPIGHFMGILQIPYGSNCHRYKTSSPIYTTDPNLINQSHVSFLVPAIIPTLALLFVKRLIYISRKFV